ncbi:MFS transporter [Buchnera aphidicola (Pemphigus obesinymphae)]|uniref:MFS transporter n=1 Tax=Buchnera aphidicola TaxID=9 RepID=UPI0022387A8D|nr:MFS transporter [Buchnera aphidicola]MCW5196370.1 MFS transporter [Buchnera aphidicola (Pemphigus obesinymphae)]
MKRKELQAVVGLCLVLNLRIFGVFMVLPVISTYGLLLEHGNKFLVGVAIGIYGLTQSFFQIPFGFFSDKIGRKSVILFGLILFFLGSCIAGMTYSIWGLIIGRALQGSGAISATCMAYISDFVEDVQYTKVMSLIGITYGLTFALSIIIGPMIISFLNFQALFWITVFLAFVAILITYFFIPNIVVSSSNFNYFSFKKGIYSILQKYDLMRLYFGIFILHVLLMFIFILLPLQLVFFKFSLDEHWKLYLVIIFISFIFVTGIFLCTEMKLKIMSIFLISNIFIILSEVICYSFIFSCYIFLLGIEIFFIAFNVLESLIPSLVGKKSCSHYRGTAMGTYSTAQFLGIACGGILGGWILSMFDILGLLISGLFFSILWFLVSVGIKNEM